MRDSEIEARFEDIEETLENLDLDSNVEDTSLEELEESMEERLENMETSSEVSESDFEDLKQDVSTLKMQLGKLRSRVQDLEEDSDEE